MTASSFADQAFIERQLPAHPESVAVARRLVREAAAGTDAAVAEDAVLVMCELVSNAVEHGGGGMVTVAVTPMGGAVEVAVRNRCPRRPGGKLPRRPWRMPPPDASRGRGLPIVASVASALEVIDEGDELEVRARVGGPVRP